MLNKLYEGYMIGAAEINTDLAAKAKAISILAKGFNVDETWAKNMIRKVRLTTHGDNVNFFGLNPSFKGVKGQELYEKMASIYNAIGLAPANVPAWRTINDTTAIKAFNLTGPGFEAEGGFTFTKAKEADKTVQELSSQTIRISFPTGSATLDENAKMIIEMKFADTARQFAGARVRINGHTDNVGNPNTNQRLSERRAKSVADYLVNEYGFDRNRFVIVGKGQYEPIADNTNDEGRAKNRRTELQLIK
jgi:NitT/TauT family transport system substrate-binding protein